MISRKAITLINALAALSAAILLFCILTIFGFPKTVHYFGSNWPQTNHPPGYESDNAPGIMISWTIGPAEFYYIRVFQRTSGSFIEFRRLSDEGFAKDYPLDLPSNIYDTTESDATLLGVDVTRIRFWGIENGRCLVISISAIRLGAYAIIFATMAWLTPRLNRIRSQGGFSMQHGLHVARPGTASHDSDKS